MKKNIFSIFLLLLCLCYTSCSASTPSQSTFNNSISAPSFQSSATTPLTALQNNGGINWGASTQDGFYYVNTAVRKDGSCNLMYADYKSEQIIYLCSQANCLHDSSSCTSYLLPTPGGILPERIGDKIILFYMNSIWSDENEVPAKVECINLDGSNRQILHTFRPEQTPHTTMVTDGQSIYFVLETVQNDGTICKNLAMLDTTTGNMDILQEMSVEQSEYIWGCCGEDLIVYQHKTSGEDSQQLLRWNFVTDDKSVIYNWKSSDPFPFLYESSLGFKGDDGYYHIKSLESNSDFVFTQYPLLNSCSTNIVFADDSNILIREVTQSPNNNISIRFISLNKDGSIKEWSLLTDEYDDKSPFIPVYSLNDQEYLVYVGDAYESNPMIEDDGTSQFIQVPRRLYSIMSKIDFWSGNNIQHPLQYTANHS